MDEIRSIRLFLAVAEHRSFAEAARRLSVQPAAVTRAVSALERRLGTQLLVRTTRQVSLTAAGASYAARVRGLVDGLDAAARELAQDLQPESGLIRINAPVSLGIKVLPDVLAEFQAAFPAIQIAVTLDDEFVDILEAECDLAIRISGPPGDKSTIWRKLCLVERVLVAPPGSPLADAASPADLPPERCLAYDAQGREELWELRRDGRRQAVRAGARLTCNNGDMLARLLTRTDGVALLPRFIVEDELRRGTLAAILPEWKAPDIWLTLYYPPYTRLPPRIAAFSDFFEDYVLMRHPLFPSSDPQA